MKKLKAKIDSLNSNSLVFWLIPHKKIDINKIASLRKGIAYIVINSSTNSLQLIPNDQALHDEEFIIEGLDKEGHAIIPEDSYTLLQIPVPTQYKTELTLTIVAVWTGAYYNVFCLELQDSRFALIKDVLSSEVIQKMDMYKRFVMEQLRLPAHKETVNDLANNTKQVEEIDASIDAIYSKFKVDVWVEFNVS